MNRERAQGRHATAWVGLLLLIALAAPLGLHAWQRGAAVPDARGVAGRPPKVAGGMPAPVVGEEVLNRTPPADMAVVLQLPSSAILREPIPRDDARSIICGDVSLNGREAFRRFVYNRAGAAGALDDGTALFDRFARKICRLH